MNVACPSCQTRYAVDDGRIPPSGVTIKCPKCQHVFVAKRDGASAAKSTSSSSSAQPAPSGGAVALPGAAAQSGRSAPVPLPGAGSRGAVPLPGASAKSAVPLPGGQARVPLPAPTPRAAPPAPAPNPAADLDDGELDLGLDADLPVPKAPSAVKPKMPAPTKAPPKPPVAAKSAGAALDFIDETAGRAGVGDRAKESSHEYRVRRRNGRTDGPFGAGRIITMLRNKEFTGGEDISEDGVQWRSMTSNPEFNAVINELASHDDALSFGNIDLPAPRDLPDARGPSNLPAPGELPKSKEPSGRGAHAQVAKRRVSSNSVEGGEFNLGFEEEEEAGHGAPAHAQARSAPSPHAPPADLDDLDLDRPPDEPKRAKKRAPAPEPTDGLELPPEPASAPAGGSDGLEVGEIPQLPPIWQTYRKPIIAFAGVIVVFLIGFFTHLWHPCGAYGLKCVAALFTPPPPPPPQAPPPPPPKLADAKEIASLIDEGAFESFRSVLATIDQLGPTLPDNMLAANKARGFATLAFGPPDFPLEVLSKSVDALNGIDLTKAMGGNTAAANNEILKARSSVAISSGAFDKAQKELAAALEQKPDDRELALLLGLARHKSGDEKGALEALDKAIVADSKYAPALHAIGDVILSLGNKDDAATWYVKALEAEPSHARSGVAAAKIYEEENLFGQRRRVLGLAAEKASRGLPPDKRAPLVYEAALAFMDAGQDDRALPFAQEAATLDPANVTYVAAAAIALAASGSPKEGQKLLDPVLQRDPNNLDALLARSRVHFKMEDVAKAFIDLDAAKRLAARDPRVPLLEARFNIELAKLNDAREALQRAIKVEGAGARANIELGRVELDLGDVDSAFKNASEAVKKEPHHAAAHALLGDCFLLRDEVEKAVESYSTALKLDDENVSASTGYANALRDTGAKNPKLRSRISESIPIYLKLLAANPKNPTVMFEYGRALELEGEVNAALELYREAATLDQKDVRPHLKMAAANIEKDPPDLVAANKSISIARRIEAGSGRTNGHVRFWEARLALLEGKVHDAEAAMRSAVEAEPRNAIFHYWLGRMLEANNSLYEAVGYYEKAVSMNSRLALAWRALGRTAMERNQYDKAREMFDKYRESAPEDFSVWVDIGETYTKQNREDEAMKAFQTAVKYDPKNSKALMEIGVVLERRGHTKEARDFFERAARADANHGDAWCYLGAALNTKEKLTKDARKALEKCVSSKNSSEDLKALARDALSTGGRTN
jgi:predicted Zn finger-like uncharacterized protein